MLLKKVVELLSIDGDVLILLEMLSWYLVVFKFGSVVFYNMGYKEREECLKFVRLFMLMFLVVLMMDDY